MKYHYFYAKLQIMISTIPHIKHTSSGNFFLIAGPCVVESESLVFEVARTLQEITNQLQIPFIFKASYRKANRTKLDSFSGIGDEKALEILAKVSRELKVPICTDVHESVEVDKLKGIADIIQIPAFLCRQTDLLIAAGKSGSVVNIKKGQFLAPSAMKYAIEKVNSTGNTRVMLTERGTSLGYGDLVVDFRGIPILKSFNVPVVLDITHSLQLPNRDAGVTGGQPEFIETIAKAGVATGIDGIFMETHPEPGKALSDGANMLALNKVKNLLEQLIRIRKAIIN
jgi:2-dehydro-3-deoxyphosphooctonate aldolase (KDO 8-P synthase)